MVISVFRMGNKEGLYVLYFFALEKTRQIDNKYCNQNKNEPHPQNKNKPNELPGPLKQL